MQLFRFYCDCKKEIWVRSVDAGLPLNCKCGRVVQVPSLVRLRSLQQDHELINPPEEMPSIVMPPVQRGKRRLPLQCPHCGSNAVERLPENGLIPNAGYLCLNCDARMKPTYSNGIYLACILISGLVFTGIVFMSIRKGADVLVLEALIACLTISGFSLRQLYRKSVIRGKSRNSRLRTGFRNRSS